MTCIMMFVPQHLKTPLKSDIFTSYVWTILSVNFFLWIWQINEFTKSLWKIKTGSNIIMFINHNFLVIN